MLRWVVLGALGAWVRASYVLRKEENARAEKEAREQRTHELEVARLQARLDRRARRVDSSSRLTELQTDAALRQTARVSEADLRAQADTAAYKRRQAEARAQARLRQEERAADAAARATEKAATTAAQSAAEAANQQEFHELLVRLDTVLNGAVPEEERARYAANALSERMRRRR